MTVPKSSSKKAKAPQAPRDTTLLRREVTSFVNQILPDGRRLGAIKYGVYAFYDYDDEPIYMGQTMESIGTRIRRHLTNQRTDAVAMSVLDPFEVARAEAWPIDAPPGESIKSYLNRAEYTVFQRAIDHSTFGAILNEKTVLSAGVIELPASYSRRLVPDEIYEERRHSDVRIARRAATIASLARIISEREPSKRLRAVLQIQAKRLEHLTTQRLQELGIDPKQLTPADDEKPLVP